MNGKFLIRGYAPADEAALTAAYWLVVVAIFLWYTFGPNGNGQPQYSWFIWAIAGVVYAACVVAAKAFVRKKV